MVLTGMACYRESPMTAPALYVSLLVLIASVAATTLCFAYYGAFKHRSAFWLSLCMAGVSLFALAGLVFQLSTPTTAMATVGPIGLSLTWQALGSALVALALPRFLLSAFGALPPRSVYRGLDAIAALVLVLSVVRVVSGWSDLSRASALPNTILRITLYALISAALASTLVFQSRLPDRNLFRTILAQIGTLVLLFPFVVLEDLGLFKIPLFPYLSGQILLGATSAYAALHARKSLKRPKYVVDDAPSPYFVGRFGISERELEVVSGVLEGLGNGEIAERLFISPRTVEKHLYNIYQKAGIKNRLQLYNLLRSDAR